MYYLYVLPSKDSVHYYIGVTGDLLIRLKKHNSGSTKSTKPYLPWVIVYIEEFNTKQEAMKREYYLKSPQGYEEKRTIFNKFGEIA